MFGSPGSLTAYATSVRTGLPPPNDTPPTVGPASYSVKPIICRPCVEESAVPFLTTSKRKLIINPPGIPSPLDYNPWQRPRYEVGSPIMRGWRRFPCDTKSTNSAGSMYKLPDPWLKMIEDCKEMESKRWRTVYNKCESNRDRSDFRQLELREFVQGWDRKKCQSPWGNEKQKAQIPGPIYDTYGIMTSKSRTIPMINFQDVSSRPPLFSRKGGFGPADFTISRCLNTNGGILLDKTDNPKESRLRYFDFIVDKASKTIYPTPFNHFIRRLYDKGVDGMALVSPFKSRVSRNIFSSSDKSPGPADYFSSAMTLEDLIPRIHPRYPNSSTCPPVPPGFNGSGDRFLNVQLIEEHLNRPSPCSYNIPSFTDLLDFTCKRQKPAIHNPKLGFLTSADARPEVKLVVVEGNKLGLDWGAGNCGDDHIRKWRNLRPQNAGKTYTFHGPVRKYADSPGPIYDTRSAAKAIKAKKDWWDPRRVTGTGFNNSGPARNPQLGLLDMDIPGPGSYYPVKPPKRCSPLNVKTTGPRRLEMKTFGPGPNHLLHEKVGSSMWRTTHLGTYNIYLKGVQRQHPNAGGFRSHGPLHHQADAIAQIHRVDDYAPFKCSSTPACTPNLEVLSIEKRLKARQIQKQSPSQAET